MRREVDGRAPETVALLTSLPAAQLAADRWLQLNRDHGAWRTGCTPGWIYPGATIDAACGRAMASGCTASSVAWPTSLFMEWRSQQRKPRRHSTTDFAALMAAEHGRRVMLTVTARRPNLLARS